MTHRAALDKAEARYRGRASSCHSSGCLLSHTLECPSVVCLFYGKPCGRSKGLGCTSQKAAEAFL